MPTSSEPLTKLATVKSELQISSTTHDSYLDRQIKVASQVFTHLAGARQFHKVVDQTVEVGSQGGQYLFLDGFYPVTNIQEIRFDGYVVDADNYELEEDNGMIRHLGSGWTSTEEPAGAIAPVDAYSAPLQDYAIDFDAGWATPEQASQGVYTPRNLPFDLEETIITYVVGQYRQRGRDEDVESKSLGDGSIKWVRREGHSVPQTFAMTAEQYAESGGAIFA